MMSERFSVLVRKEWRRHRAVVVASAILTGIPYVVILVFQTVPHSIGDVLGFGGYSAVILSFLLSGFFAGNALAGERQTRSIEFLAYLPIDRRLDLLSRISVAAGLTIALFAIHLSLLCAGISLDSISVDWQKDSRELVDITFSAMAIVIGIFGVSWFFSMIWRSPVLPAVVGLGMIGMLFILGMRSGWFTSHPPKVDISVIALSLGLAGLILGSVWHLKRRVLQ